MPSGQIALLRIHGHFTLGLLWTATNGKLWAMDAEGTPLRVSRQQVLWETDVRLDDVSAPPWIRHCEVIAEGQPDLEEAWRVVQGEVPWLSLEDLSGLVWSAGQDATHACALLLALHRTPVSYFLLRDRTLVPQRPEEVDAQLRRLDQARVSAAEGEAFREWLAEGVEPPSGWTDRQREWRQEMVDFAVRGDASETARRARRLLQEIEPDAADRPRLTFDLLVRRGVFGPDEPLGLLRLGVPLSFPPEVVADAERLAARAVPSEGRRDLTGLHVVTIDESSTLDMDDGLSLEAEEGGSVLGIHISDVASLVPVGGAVDREARRRVASLYLPERVLPMIPEVLSRGAASLVSDAPRPAVSLLVHFDEALGMTGSEIVSSVVRSTARLSYEGADAIVGGAATAERDLLRDLQAIAGSLREGRIAAGALELARPEVSVSVAEDGRVDVAVVERETPARRLVSEMMILANRLVGEFCRDNDIPAVYRTQDPVDLEGVVETSVEQLRQYQIFRRIRSASLGVTPGVHALLGVPVYLQATSPIRRYPDLVVQRQVLSFLRDGEPLYDRAAVTEMVHEMDGALRDLGRAETERKGYWLLKALGACTGETFPAIVLDTRDRHALVELERLLLRTTVYLGPTAAIGDSVRLKLQDVDLWRRDARFTYEPDGAHSPSSPTDGGRPAGGGT